MTRLKRSCHGLAFAMVAALLVAAAPAAWAGQPEDVAQEKGERVAAKETEKAEKETEKASKPEATGKKKKKAITGGRCEDRVFSRVFKPWHDRALYTVAPGGDFETLAEGWTLEGAALAADSSPFQLGAALGASSLELPAGASALSPPICVERGFPSFRLVAKSLSTEQAVVKVQVIYANGRHLATGRVTPAAEWAPARKLSLAQGRFKLRRGRSARVQLRFAVTAGTVRIDDVYIDPRMWR